MKKDKSSENSQRAGNSKNHQYEVTVGLEIHAELNTKTKLFCSSKNDPDETRPNVNVCPVCMGHPGTLPVLNKEAVRKIIMVGLALGGQISELTEFDRKHYFYPDIPKGYQISQYKHPLVTGGSLNGVAITRVHLEEDTARSSHDAHEGGQFSLVDFNRSGVPLMELVTEPVIHSAGGASRFARELQLMLQYLGASEANMEKGEMRVEANISVARHGVAERGTKVEVKNLNSFRAVEKAIEFETARHIELIESGGKVLQETRGFDENSGKTFSQRLKEESHDYRYFPDPDIPKLKASDIPELNPKNVAKDLPELPVERRVRFKKDFGLREEDIEIYIRDKKWGDYFENVAEHFDSNKELVGLASNYINSDLAGLVKENPNHWRENEIATANMAKLVDMIGKGIVSSRGAKDILKIMFERGGRPEEIAKEENLIQKNDTSELATIVEKIINEQTKVVTDYKAGKTTALQFLIGQAMKATRGSANPETLRKIFVEKLD